MSHIHIHRNTFTRRNLSIKFMHHFWVTLSQNHNFLGLSFSFTFHGFIDRLIQRTEKKTIWKRKSYSTHLNIWIFFFNFSFENIFKFVLVGYTTRSYSLFKITTWTENQSRLFLKRHKSWMLCGIYAAGDTSVVKTIFKVVESETSAFIRPISSQSSTALIYNAHI